MNEPDWNEEDLEETLMDDLPDGRNDKILTTEQDERIYRSLSSFFDQAWID